MIRSFRHRGLKRLYEWDDSSLIRSDLRDRVEVMLAQLDVAGSPHDMRLPRYRLHALKGNLKGVLVCHGEGQLAHHFPFREWGCLRRGANRLPLTKRGTVMPMKNPPHPGKVVRVSCLEPLDLSVTEGARVLGVSRQALSNLVNGRARISGDMAIRLAKAFGSTTESWIRLQAAYDVAQAQAREQEIEVDRYEPQPAL